MNDNFYTNPDLAKLTGLDAKRVRYLISRDGIQPVRVVGRTPFYSEEGKDRFLKSVANLGVCMTCGQRIFHEKYKHGSTVEEPQD